ncbi:MAG: hypothetical protein A3A33_01995 [Candidatus Yanofskybacteria bacterium RIFCSPLOWO2_01_FULL_49_25]|uniref:Uncharacterized protein n=1 Tax=Candidatus Yanofskybacteria bacterium RIFCSPLOWO2_01_FULL_49_25 TaxID=1802701 RepID=A0A1F8GVI6_9BACT|nr:MAG: hypothetical protein A3A33_01995 [Candidatus Yanofskybacteria bacterium RIFCSPLOWO2_01_FULL_49_25]
MALAIVTILIITIIIMLISGEYFEVSFGIVNRFFPQGYVDTANLKIPNQNFATYLYPKSLYYSGHISQWIQYLLVIPVFLKFGWVVALIYFIFILFVWKLIVAFLLVKNYAIKRFALELMYANLKMRMARKDFKMYKLTVDGERVMENFFRETLAFIDSLPEHDAKSTVGKT